MFNIIIISKIIKSRKIIEIKKSKNIALVAHDNRKDDLLEWASYNRGKLSRQKLCTTGTTGRLLEEELVLDIIKLLSGPLAGDQQIGVKIAEQEINFLLFFWDPLQPLPHDPDIQALLRIAIVWNIPVASNWATADFLVSSPLLEEEYAHTIPDYSENNNRPLTKG